VKHESGVSDQTRKHGFGVDSRQGREAF
jgi:hypothetical protein